MAALVLQARSNVQIAGQFVGYVAQELFEQTANVVGTTLDDTGPIASLTLQGAGLINAYAAVNTETFIVPSKLLLNDTRYPQYTQEILIWNMWNQQQVYTVTHVPAQTVLTYSGNQVNLSPPGIAGGTATATISTNKVTLNAGQSTLVKVTFQPPVGLDPSTFPVYTGQIMFQSARETVVATYQGMAAAMYNAPVIDNSTWCEFLMFSFSGVLLLNLTFGLVSFGRLRHIW